MSRMIGYIRVSKVGDRGGDSYISPELQRKQIANYAAARSHEVIEWVKDENQSGTRWTRPGFQRALEAVRDGRADGIICAKLDRFARSVTDGRRALQELKTYDGELVLVTENLDTTTAMGNAMFTILLAFAELEVDRIREGWKAARGHALKNGVHATRAAPGYKRQDRRLVPDPKVAPAVVAAFRLRAAGGSLSACCELLDEQAPRTNGRAWATTTVGQMFGRRTYLGEGEAGTKLDAIVPRPVWEAAQVAGGVAPTRAQSDERLLTGLLYCETCGFKLTGSTDGSGYHHYRCRGRHADVVCTARARVSAKRADPFVEQAFLDWLAENRVAVASADDTVDLAGLTTAAELAEAELVAYMKDTLVSTVGREAFNAGAKARQAAVDEARAALATSAGPKTPLHLDLLSLWPTLAIAERREILAGAIRRVVVSPGRGDGRIRIVWRDGDEDAAVTAAGDLGEREAD